MVTPAAGVGIKVLQTLNVDEEAEIENGSGEHCTVVYEEEGKYWNHHAQGMHIPLPRITRQSVTLTVISTVVVPVVPLAALVQLITIEPVPAAETCVTPAT